MNTALKQKLYDLGKNAHKTYIEINHLQLSC